MKRAIAITLTFLLLLLVFNALHPISRPNSRHVYQDSHSIEPAIFPRKVWQTWLGTKKLGDEPLRFTRTWIENNPGHGYELLTDDTARDCIKLRFPTGEKFLETWDNIADYILRADFIRYLTLLGDGGTYTDIDTDCTKPIGDWLTVEQQSSADIVVGIEYDSRYGEVSADMYADAQFCTWTIMSKPGSPHMRHVVNRIHANLETAIDVTKSGSIHALNATEVLRLTGPRVRELCP